MERSKGKVVRRFRNESWNHDGPEPEPHVLDLKTIKGNPRRGLEFPSHGPP